MEDCALRTYKAPWFDLCFWNYYIMKAGGFWKKIWKREKSESGGKIKSTGNISSTFTLSALFYYKHFSLILSLILFFCSFSHVTGPNYFCLSSLFFLFFFFLFVLLCRVYVAVVVLTLVRPYLLAAIMQSIWLNIWKKNNNNNNKIQWNILHKFILMFI